MRQWGAVEARGRRQAGVIVREQLAALGVTSNALRWMLDSGRLRRVMHEVFLLAGVEWGPVQRMRAVGLLRRQMALSHFSAARVWKLEVPEVLETHVVVRRATHLALPAPFVLDRTQRAFVMVHSNGFVCTSLERTVFDLREVLSGRALERAYESARRIDPHVRERLEDALSRLKGATGLSELRRVMGSMGDQPTESELERRMLRRLREAGLEVPRLQYVLFDGEGFVARADFAWPLQRVALFGDGWAFHSGRAAFERDLRQRNRLMAMGWLPLAVSSTQVMEEDGWLTQVREVLRVRNPVRELNFG